MSLTPRSGGKCVICAFRAADRRLLSLASTPGRNRSSQARPREHHDGLESTQPQPQYPSVVRRTSFPSSNVRSSNPMPARQLPGTSEPAGPKYKAAKSVFLNYSSAQLPSANSEARHMKKRWIVKNSADSPDHIVERRWKRMVKELEDSTFIQDGTEEEVPRIREICGISTPEEFRKVADQFWSEKLSPALSWATRFAKPWTAHDTAENLSEAERRIMELESERIYSQLFDNAGVGERGQRRDMVPALKSMLIGHIQNSAITAEQFEHTKSIADFRYPIEWYPNARAMQRKIHLHVGPTNSGKTYHALKRLEEAETGVYAGPLRLLAHEVYSRLNAKGKVCALITGEERRIPDNYRGQMSSCTVEMVPLGVQVDVAVIDEIQMLADTDRGWAWTQAFLGVQAKEVHLCGEVRTIEIIQKLCKLIGDELIIHNYERLTPLECMGKSFGGKFDKLQKGDAVIVFSRVGIHAMKKQIEAETGKRCAVIYGSLPPETRAQQAALFNDQDNDYDYLVASDAVGMGLNLAIRRIIFESTVKFNGRGGYDQLTVSELKQIAGRAGRYKTAAEGMQDRKNEGTREDGTPRHPPRNVGLATTLDPNDHMVLKIAMETDVEPIKSCGIFPPSWAYKRFAAYFPRGTPFTFVLTRLPEIAVLSPMFFICDMTDQYRVADAIEMFDLTVEDRMIFMASPADMRRAPEILVAFASHVAAQSSAELCDIKELELELLDVKVEGQNYLQRLERLHNALTLYLWLSYRFAGVFVSQPLAFHVKGLVEEKIDAALARVEVSKEEQARRRKFRQQKVEEMKEQRERMAIESEGAPTPYSSAVEDQQEPLMDPLEEAAISGEQIEDVSEKQPEDTLEKEKENDEDDEDDENDEKELDDVDLIDKTTEDQRSA